MDTLGCNIHMRKEILLHKQVIGGRMDGIESDIFIQVKAGDPAEIEPILTVHPHQ